MFGTTRIDCRNHWCTPKAGVSSDDHDLVIYLSMNSLSDVSQLVLHHDGVMVMAISISKFCNLDS